MPTEKQTDQPPRSDIKTLSPTATKIFVLSLVALALVVAIAAAIYLTNVARDAPPPEEAPIESTS